MFTTTESVTAKAVRLYSLPVNVAGKPSSEPAGNTRSNRGESVDTKTYFALTDEENPEILVAGAKQDTVGLDRLLLTERLEGTLQVLTTR